jgi:hypothetical protein
MITFLKEEFTKEKIVSSIGIIGGLFVLLVATIAVGTVFKVVFAGYSIAVFIGVFITVVGFVIFS